MKSRGGLALSMMRSIRTQRPTKTREPNMSMSTQIIAQITDGRTDLVMDYLSAGHAAAPADQNGVPVIQWCAYYGDVTAIKYLLAHGESIQSLGGNLGLSGAAFHGHWRLCQYLIEQGADANEATDDTAETPLHSALCTPNRLAHDLVIKVLLGHGANPNRVTKPSVETGCFMRDCRTKAETPLHRAAAFGTEDTIQMLLNAGAAIDAKDMNGDSPLTWASWYGRPDSILTRLCYGQFHIRPNRRSMGAYLLGEPHV
jgi:ankyrin repeat protein